MWCAWEWKLKGLSYKRKSLNGSLWEQSHSKQNDIFWQTVNEVLVFLQETYFVGSFIGNGGHKWQLENLLGLI